MSDLLDETRQLIATFTTIFTTAQSLDALLKSAHDMEVKSKCRILKAKCSMNDKPLELKPRTESVGGVVSLFLSKAKVALNEA